MTSAAIWAIALVTLLLPPIPNTSDSSAWPQWGGPSRNFVVGARELASFQLLLLSLAQA